MKKLLTMMLILALSVSCLAGCGSSEPAETETTSKEETQQTEETSTEAEVESEEASTEEVTEETSEEINVSETNTYVPNLDSSFTIKNDAFSCTFQYDSSVALIEDIGEDDIMNVYIPDICHGAFSAKHEADSGEEYYQNIAGNINAESKISDITEYELENGYTVKHFNVDSNFEGERDVKDHFYIQLDDENGIFVRLVKDNFDSELDIQLFVDAILNISDFTKN